MKITETTTAQEVKDKTMHTLVQMCEKSAEPMKEENPGEVIRELFDMMREHSDSKEQLKIRLVEIQKMLEQERHQELSIEEILIFIKNAMNYGKFQIEISGKGLSFEEKLKQFLSETSNEEILTLYDIGQNYNANNLKAIDRMIEEGSLQDGETSEESRRILAKNSVYPEN